MDKQQLEKLIVDLGRLHRESMDIFVVLEAAHHLLPDGSIDSLASTRYMAGIALRALDELQEKIDLLGMEVSVISWAKQSQNPSSR